MEHSAKRIGYVRWFNDAAGNGIVTDLATGRCFTLHWSALVPDGEDVHDKTKWRTIREGAQVEFTYLDDPDYSVVATCRDLDWRVVYYQPVTVADFSIEKVIEGLLRDRDRLIQKWGSARYESQLALAQDYLKAKGA